MIRSTVTAWHGRLAAFIDANAAAAVDIKRGAVAKVNRNGREVARGPVLSVDRDLCAITVRGYAPETGDQIVITHEGDVS